MWKIGFFRKNDRVIRLIYMDSSNSSIGEISREWKQRADDTIKATIFEINRDNEQLAHSISKRTNAQQVQTQAARNQEALAAVVQGGMANERSRQEWAKNQIDELNDQTNAELKSIESLRDRQQTFYQRRLSDKTNEWEKVVLERRAEANQLRAMIAQLNSDINVAKSEAKADIDEAKRRAKDSTKIIRISREKKIQQIAELTEKIRKEKSQFNNTVTERMNNANIQVAQKNEQLARMQSSLQQMKSKLRNKENSNASKFRQQVRLISDLRSQLQIQKDAEKSKQNELASLRKLCTSISRKISSYKDETASLKRQLGMMSKENEEIQGEIMKLEKQMFPQVFRQSI